MKLCEFTDLIINIQDSYPEAKDADVAVEKWDDGAYDGAEVVGIRVNYDIEVGKDNHPTVFIIQK